ncbi:PREDICTED: transcription factor HES-5-like [Thamnophis sirtalis]|uniref:Transcription factor HES-5 n=1 Tax=Thamnophis sirtalis TaxID=35019 RepID=A0A6I9YPE3_9SAUR|nr:PREDICTED: transcription factor HES-5-like [Thamnophis sirtalis]
MTPSNLMFADQARRLTAKEKNKLRKPLIEKMRRDRMNSSIEQLKQLLEKELQSQRAGSKLEKANILEMAVSYLKHQNRTQGAAPGKETLSQPARRNQQRFEVQAENAFAISVKI